jgi:hypothetical protein
VLRILQRESRAVRHITLIGLSSGQGDDVLDFVGEAHDLDPFLGWVGQIAPPQQPSYSTFRKSKVG